MLSALLFLGACSSHQKKVLLYADSKIQVDESQKNIKVEDGTTQVEQELNFNSGDPVVLNISGPGGNYTLEIKEDGLFPQTPRRIRLLAACSIPVSQDIHASHSRSCNHSLIV